MKEAPTTPFFRARLEPSAPRAATLFLSGGLDPYGIESLEQSACEGVGSIDIRVAGMRLDEARLRLERPLITLARRGVEVKLTAL